MTTRIKRVCTAPPNSGTIVLGRSIPDILDEACERHPNARAYNRFTGSGWETLSNEELRRQGNEIALGLLALGLQRGDRVAMYMHSDTDFLRIDMGCQIAGLVDVPVFLNYAPELLVYTINHSEAKVLVVADMELLEHLLPLLPQYEHISALVVVHPTEALEGMRTQIPASWKVLSLDVLREEGRKALKEDPEAPTRLRAQIRPEEDVATIIYTSGTTGTPKGVMLTHQNFTFDALTSVSDLRGFERGAAEVALSFLPMHHVFERAMQYAYMNYGTTVYFTHPNNVAIHLREVRPTIFATVPRVLEKIFERILMMAQEMTGLKKTLLDWAIGLARRYELGKEPRGWYAIQLKLADKLVFSKWREALGGRLKFAIAGGAALRAELANIFGAAGVNVLQGYGLTETSPVITYNRPYRNRAGTVGQPLPGVEVAIAEDGEILTRGPHVMKGYFKNPEATREAIDEDGWFHTGDIGELTEDCFLIITDRKKNMFKLSTGKYVTPQPIEDHLRADPLVDQAVVIGEGEKFAAVLIFPNEENLRVFATQHGLDAEKPLDQLIREPQVVEHIRLVIAEVNEHLPHWSQVRRFALIPGALTIENEMLTPTLKVKRRKVYEKYADVLRALYQTPPPEGEWVIEDVEAHARGVRETVPA